MEHGNTSLSSTAGGHEAVQLHPSPSLNTSPSAEQSHEKTAALMDTQRTPSIIGFDTNIRSSTVRLESQTSTSPFVQQRILSLRRIRSRKHKRGVKPLGRDSVLSISERIQNAAVVESFPESDLEKTQAPSGMFCI